MLSILRFLMTRGMGEVSQDRLFSNATPRDDMNLTDYDPFQKG